MHTITQKLSAKISLSTVYYACPFTIIALYYVILVVPPGAAIPCCSQYGAGVGDIHFSSVTCSGNENRITHCSYNTGEVANHQHDVRVQCQQGVYAN